MLSLRKFSAFLSLVTFVGCSIVKDSDVTSIDQLNSLKLRSIEIIQSLSSSPLSNTATIIDSAANSPVTIDFAKSIPGTIVNFQLIKWPNVPTNSKLQFSSGVTSGITLSISFYQNGLPRTTAVYQNGIPVEVYKFLYNQNWQVTHLVTTDSIISASNTVYYRDSLVYNSSGLVASLIRIYSKTSHTTLNYAYSQYGNNTNLGGSSVSYGSLNYFFGNCLCPGNSDGSCFGCSSNSTSGGGNTQSNYIIQQNQTLDLLSQLTIEDVKITNGSNCGSGSGAGTNYDTYYFHPLMILKNKFSHGDVLLNIYSIDWWKQGAPLSQTNYKGNESISLNFNYAQ
jgi:hypothetical protein